MKVPSNKTEMKGNGIKRKKGEKNSLRKKRCECFCFSATKLNLLILHNKITDKYQEN